MVNKTESEQIFMRVDPNHPNFTWKMTKEKANALCFMKMDKLNMKLYIPMVSSTENTFIIMIMDLFLINKIMKKEILFKNDFNYLSIKINYSTSFLNKMFNKLQKLNQNRITFNISSQFLKNILKIHSPTCYKFLEISQNLEMYKKLFASKAACQIWNKIKSIYKMKSQIIVDC
jgi:hypothetical protein